VREQLRSPRWTPIVEGYAVSVTDVRMVVLAELSAVVKNVQEKKGRISTLDIELVDTRSHLSNPRT
jgi:hypothetical protein